MPKLIKRFVFQSRSYPIFLFFQQNLVSQSPSAVRYSLSPFGPVFDGSSSLGALCSLKPCKKNCQLAKLLAGNRDRPRFKQSIPEFFSEALRKTRSMCKQKRSLVFIQTAHAGTDLDLNKASSSFSAKALRKTRSMCKQKRSLVFIQSAHAGTDLDFKQNVS